MKPKVLVVYFGEYRTGNEYIPTHKFLLNDKYEFFVSFSLWEKYNSENSYKFIDSSAANRFYTSISHEEIQDNFKKHFPSIPCKVKLYPLSYHDTTDEDYLLPPLFQSLKKTLITIDETEQECPYFNFDYILLIRPDLKFRDNVDFVDSKIQNIGKRKIIFIDGNNSRDDIGDLWFFSSPSVIKSFIADITSEKFTPIPGMFYHTRLKAFAIEQGYKCLPGVFTNEQKIVIKRIGNKKFNVGYSFDTLNDTRIRMPIKQHLFAFDLDGTLVDTKQLHFDALNKAIADVAGMEYTISEEEKNLYEGRPTREKLWILNDRKNLEKSLNDKIFEEKQKNTIEALKELPTDIRLVKLFSEIRNNDNSIAVVTNCIRETAEIMLDRIGVSKYVNVLVSVSDGFLAKPAPDMYFHAMQESNIKYDKLQTIIFEDSDIGWNSAFNTGANVVRVKSRKSINNNLMNILEVLFPVDRSSLSYTNGVSIKNLKPVFVDVNNIFALSKKYLIVYFGEYRTFPACIKTHTFLNSFSECVDVVFSTWSKSTSRNVYRHTSVGTRRDVEHNFQVTEDMIQEVFTSNGYDNSVEIYIEDLPKHLDRRDVHFTLAYLTSLQNAYSKVKSIMHNYDRILFIRPDMYFPTHLGLYDVDPAKSRTPSNPQYLQIARDSHNGNESGGNDLGCYSLNGTASISDQYWYGTPSTIEKFFNKFLYSASQEAISGNWHSWLYKCAMDCELEITNLPHIDHNARENFRGLLPSTVVYPNDGYSFLWNIPQVNRFPANTDETFVEIMQKNIYFTTAQNKNDLDLIYENNAKSVLKEVRFKIDECLLKDISSDVMDMIVLYSNDDADISLYEITCDEKYFHKKYMEAVNVNSHTDRSILVSNASQIDMNLLERLGKFEIYHKGCKVVHQDRDAITWFSLHLDLRNK